MDSYEDRLRFSPRLPSKEWQHFKKDKRVSNLFTAPRTLLCVHGFDYPKWYPTMIRDSHPLYLLLVALNYHEMRVKSLQTDVGHFPYSYMDSKFHSGVEKW